MNDNNTPSIADINSNRLAAVSVLFCNANGLEVTDELVIVLGNSIIYGVATWYAQNGKKFSPATELIEEDAIRFALEKAQEVVLAAEAEVLASVLGK